MSLFPLGEFSVSLHEFIPAGLSSHLTEEERQLSKKDQMQLVAARMQNKFKNANSGATLAALADDDN